MPSFGPLNARDTVYVGPALADDIRQCDGSVEMMSYWTFDDVFEEDGVVEGPFHGGFGLIAAEGIKKPSYNAFALLHKLGDARVANDAPNVLVTRRSDGKLVVAAWNLVDPDQKGSPEDMTLEFRGVKTQHRVQLSRVDEQHGNTLAAYEKMGKPRYPTQKQIEQLNQASNTGAPESVSLKNGRIEFEIPVNGLVLLELQK